VPKWTGVELKALTASIAQEKFGNNAQAIRFYLRSAAQKPNADPDFKVGLTFNDPEVSQDGDAVDACRRTRALDPSFDRAKERLAATTPRLANFARAALSGGFRLGGRGGLFRSAVPLWSAQEGGAGGLAAVVRRREIESQGVATEVLAMEGLASAKPGFADRLIQGACVSSGGSMATFEQASGKLNPVRVL
jgi:hypothetical protein